MNPPPENCPNCGAALPRRAKACPECGSDEQTGWSEDAYAGGLGISEHDFDYSEFVERELGGESRIKPRGVSWLWWAIAVLLLGMFLGWWLGMG